MAKTVGDFAVERLPAWRIQRVFGYPGDGINGIMAGFEHAGDERPRFIQAGTRRWRPSWPLLTQSLPANPASASPPRARAPSIC